MWISSISRSVLRPAPESIKSKSKASSRTMTGEFALPGSCGFSDVVQPWVQGSKIVAPDTYCGTVGIDSFPGGENQEYLTGTQYPIGATVSTAKI